MVYWRERVRGNRQRRDHFLVLEGARDKVIPRGGMSSPSQATPTEGGQEWRC